MTRRSNHKRKIRRRGLAVLLGAALVAVTLLTGAVAILSAKGAITLPEFLRQKAAVSADAPVRSELTQPSNDGQTSPAEKRLPDDEARAVVIKAGRDYKIASDREKTCRSIDSALDDAKELTMNTVVFDTVDSDGLAIYSSKTLKTREAVSFDPLEYAVSAARAKGLYVFLTYNITDVALGEKISPLGKATSALIDNVSADIAAFAKKYSPDGIMIDGYYNTLTTKSYSNYLLLGGGAGFEEYMRSIPEALVRIVSDELARSAPSVSVGLLSEAVWANSYEDESGSETRSLFSTLADGNSDTIAFFEEGLVDFIAVKAFGAIDNSGIPYQTVVSWWNEKAAEYGFPLYIVHAASKAVTDEEGWGEYDQLARQVIAAREAGSYRGSIFDSLERLLENPKECASKLIGYYAGSVKEEHIMQDLELTMPQKTTFTSFDPTVIFVGHSDPNTDATINGVEIETDENGYFQLEMSLTEGDNVFEIDHKGKTVTYNITRVTEVVKEVSPGSGRLNVDGATKLTIGAAAYEGSKVYAVIGSQTVSLSLADYQDDDEYRDTAYKRYSGVFTVPDAKQEDVNLGAITVYGEWNGITKSKQGATIVVNKRTLPSDGTPIVVTADIAETFNGGTVSQYSEPTYFPLPKGALDYAVGDEISYSFTNKNKLETYKFYRLQSGLRVFTEDITPVSVSSAAVDNAIDGVTVTSDDRYTKIILNTRQQVAYSGTYASDKLTFKFHYTNSMPESMALNRNPLFSRIDFSRDTMTLTLRESGKLMGMYPYFDGSGNLVLRFNNPPDVTKNDLDGAKIVIDPGHGGTDVGALGYLSAYPEKVVNYAIASKLASVLRNRGAEVVIYNTPNNYYSLQQRVEMASDADPHLFISVHSNSAAYNASAAGTEAYYFNYWSSGLAQFVSANVAANLNTTNRGQKHGYYYVTRTMQYPAMLLETGFMSNQNEYHKLINEGYQSNVATAIANGIGQYLQYMAASAGMTGTQSSGTMQKTAAAAPAAGKDVKLSVSAESLSLDVGDEAELTVEWEGDDEIEIAWSAEGDDKAAQLSANGAALNIKALKKGSITVTASAKGSNSSVKCTVEIE